MKTKKFGILFLSAFSLLFFFSCSKDEPSGDTFTSFDGESLTGINDSKFYYDDKGRLIEVSDRYDSMTIDYAKGTFTLEDEVYKFKTNGDGYITEITYSYDEIDEWDGYKYQYKGNGKYTITYSNDVITKMEVTYSETEKDLNTNETEKFESEGKFTLTWKSNMLTAINIKGKEKEDGETDTWEDDYIIDYGHEANAFRQYPLTITEDALYFDHGMACMAAVGMFGKGPAMLPEYIEGNDDSYYWDTDINFSLNPNGSIKREVTDYDTYTYYYNDLSSRFNSAPAVVKDKKPGKFFQKRLKERRMK